MKKLIPIAIAALFALSTAALHAQDEDAAERANDLAETQKLAEKGDAKAQFKLGNMYAMGQDGLPKDYDKALEWFKKAAKQDEYGVLYIFLAMNHAWTNLATEEQKKAVPKEMIKFVTENAASFLERIKKGAETGNAEAQFVLSQMYGSGSGVPKNEAEADKWLKKAAEGGHQVAKMIVQMREKAKKEE